MASQLTETPGPICSCGHPASEHESEPETVYFSGIFNPALAGKVETYTWMVCNHVEGDEWSGEPCGALRHSW